MLNRPAETSCWSPPGRHHSHRYERATAGTVHLRRPHADRAALGNRRCHLGQRRYRHAVQRRPATRCRAHHARRHQPCGPGYGDAHARLSEWLEIKRGDGTRPATLRTYRWLVDTHIVPTIGRIQLDKLTPLDRTHGHVQS
nr:N-terminal phage integrase SAM-like domain-containing protein [Frankia sp. Cj5]